MHSEDDYLPSPPPVFTWWPVWPGLSHPWSTPSLMEASILTYLGQPSLGMGRR